MQKLKFKVNKKNLPKYYVDILNDYALGTYNLFSKQILIHLDNIYTIYRKQKDYIDKIYLVVEHEALHQVIAKIYPTPVHVYDRHTKDIVLKNPNEVRSCFQRHNNEEHVIGLLTNVNELMSKFELELMQNLPGSFIKEETK